MCHQDDPIALQTDGVTTEEVPVPVGRDTTIPALSSRPRGRDDAPGVLVVVDIYGRSPFYDGLATELASAGFHAVVPEPFHREGPLAETTQEAAFARRARWDERRTYDEYRAVCDWLRERSPGAQRVGVVGFCLGGTLALHLAADRDDVATVCFYGFPGGTPAPPGAAAGLGAPNDRLDEMHGPILGFWGDRDERVGLDNVETLAKGLTARGVELEHHVHPGLDHSFLKAKADPAAPGHDAATASWQRTLAFLGQHLRPAERGGAE
jgi:carboxymethylenebutenolidase